MLDYEAARIDALYQLNLLDTDPSESFDRITRMASQLFNLPIAAVSLTDHDRQWFKSRVGVEHWSIPRERAPCAEVAATTGPLVIPDLLAHPCYRDSLLAQSGVRFYAGAPLRTAEGFGLGAMCVLGTEPREVTPAEITGLHDLAAMVMLQIELQHAFGRVDQVSGLPNRTQLKEDLADKGRDAPGERRLLILVDVATSDELGQLSRAVGAAHLDELVRASCRTIRSFIGPRRKLYHVGAAQFAFLAPRQVDEELLLETTRANLRNARNAGTAYLITSVIGVAPLQLGVTEPADALRIAQSAAADARAAGHELSVYSPKQDEAHRRRFTLLNDFGAALAAADQLRLVYQPRVDLASGACLGAEALLRWRHPTLGEVSPGEFIPIIEQTTLAEPTTTWVIETALAQLAAWGETGSVPKLSVNISATNLREPDFVDRLADALARHRVSADRIEIEMTESAVMGNAGQALAQLRRLADLGIELAIDDFGTGYSSLAYLQRLPASVVKIDRSFIGECASDERKLALVSAMISLSHDLGYRVVAEGIENQATVDGLTVLRCDEGQGYFFGRPMAPEEFGRWHGERATKPGGAAQRPVRKAA